MPGGSNWQGNTQCRSQWNAPHIGCEHHDRSLNITLHCSYPNDPPFLRENLRDNYPLKDSCPQVTGAFRKAMCGCHRIGNTGIGFIARQRHTFTAVFRCYIADFRSSDEPGIHALLLLQEHIGPQSIDTLLPTHDQQTRGKETAIAPYQVIEMLEDAQAISCHTNREVIGVVLPHDGSRAPACSVAERVSLQQYNTPTMLLRKMISDAGAHHTTANNDDIGCLGHGYPLSWHAAKCFRLEVKVWLQPIGKDDVKEWLAGSQTVEKPQ